MDLDIVFNELKISKEEFNNTYNPTLLGEATSGTVTITRNGTALENSTVSLDMTNFLNLGSAITNYNRLPIVILNSALPGTYNVSIKFTTKSTEAAYNEVTVTDSFVLSYPETSLTIKSGMWADNNAYAMIYVTDPG